MKLAGGVRTMSWDIGGVRITRVVELVMPFPVDFFAEATPADVAAEAWLKPDFVDASGQYNNTPSLTHLAASGFSPETIDLVVCTHLHVDHVGWNTHLVDGEWIPTFPHARYPIQCRHPEWTARGERRSRRGPNDKARTPGSGGDDECTRARDPFHRHRRWPHPLDGPGLPLLRAPRLSIRRRTAAPNPTSTH
jgi:glyoxylase-like metal-dependent hydrolase (beta-lactamase superfamily II)